ncbi:MAG: rhomboid family intramembrane serine protease [Azospirillaceae bacterium]
MILPTDASPAGPAASPAMPAPDGERGGDRPGGPGDPGGPPPHEPPPPPPREPAINAPPGTLGLVVVILAFFAVIRLGPEGLQHTLIVELSVIPGRAMLALADPLSGTGLLAAANLVSHTLVHYDLIHVLANAGFLLAFGSLVERVVGTRRFLTLFALSAALGAVVQIAADRLAGAGDMTVMFGASGGVAGAMGAAVALMIFHRGGRAARRLGLNLILALVVVNLLFALFGGAILGVDADIAWEAHLAGFAAGFLMLGPALPRVA